MVCKFRKSQRIEKKIVAVVYGDAPHDALVPHKSPERVVLFVLFLRRFPASEQNVWMSGNRFCKSVVTLVNSSTPAKFGSLANGARCEHAVQFLLQISVTEYSI